MKSRIHDIKIEFKNDTADGTSGQLKCVTFLSIFVTLSNYLIIKLLLFYSHVRDEQSRTYNL